MKGIQPIDLITILVYKVDKKGKGNHYIKVLSNASWNCVGEVPLKIIIIRIVNRKGNKKEEKSFLSKTKRKKKSFPSKSSVRAI